MKIMAFYYIVKSHNLMKIQNVFTDLFFFFFFFLPQHLTFRPSPFLPSLICNQYFS